MLDFIRKHINKSYIITGDPRRKERWQYPMDAIKYIVINMIVHRNYIYYGDSAVKIYDDHIEFFNPGKLPVNITVEQLLNDDYSSQARNKKMAAIFKELRLIEEYGSGIKSIRAGITAYGLKASMFENFQHGIRVLVFTPPHDGGVNELLRLIFSDPGKRVPFYSEKLKVPAKTVEQWLKERRTADKIMFRGSSKTGGYWKKDT